MEFFFFFFAELVAKHYGIAFYIKCTCDTAKWNLIYSLYNVAAYKSVSMLSNAVQAVQ